jgi:hypothetical protein
MRRLILVLLAVAAPSLACDNSGTTSSGITTPTTPLTSVTFTGTVDVGGSSSNTTFVVAVSGEVDITVSALGPPANVIMGLAVGIPSTTDGSCAAPLTAGQNVQASTSPLSGTLQAGTYCIKLYDVGYQTAQIGYTVTVAHS